MDFSNIEQLSQLFEQRIAVVSTLDKLEECRVEFLGNKGLVSQQLHNIAKLSSEEKREFGGRINQLKDRIIASMADLRVGLEQQELARKLGAEVEDITLQPGEYERGRLHIITAGIEEICAIFAGMGFIQVEGPDIDDAWHNFDALNIPESHPARMMHDTFYLEGDEGLLLRTHTSNVQIRHMSAGKPPFRIVSPGKVYRSDYDATHTPMFHQVEGLCIDEDVDLGHLKGTLELFLKIFFRVEDLPIRIRPSYFPFTEPSFEVDVNCRRQGSEITIGKGDDWLEVLGCGMVHNNVLVNVGVDPKKYRGFAFGMGVERLLMLKYGVADLRKFFENDIRWLHHYGV